jgi:transcriptional accessory protein Tex/SPT6
MATGEPKSIQAIDINKASIEDLLRINGIGERRAKAILALRREKGKLVLEDLKTIPHIPCTLWDPLVDLGVIKIESALRQPNVEPACTKDTTNSN